MTTPSGYVFRQIPRNASEMALQASHDRIKSITKASVQDYIASFLDSFGGNRDLTAAVSQKALTFITDKSFEQDSDQTKRHTQLVRFFNEIRQVLPSILIVDSGITPIPHTLGLIDNATNFNGKWQGQFVIYREVSLSIVIATRDQETTDTLSSLLSLMFNELRNLAGGSRITGDETKGDRWVITLPHSPPTQTATVPANITDDPKDKIWHTSLELPVRFEDCITVEKETPYVERPATAKVNVNMDIRPEITFPSTMQVNSQAKLFVNYLQDQHRIVIDNPNMATINLDTCIVTPRKLGKFKIQVVDLNKSQTQTMALAPTVVAEKEVTITL